MGPLLIIVNLLLCALWTGLAIVATVDHQWVFAIACIAAAAANGEAFYLRRKLARIPLDCACRPGKCEGKIGERCALSGFVVVDRRHGGRP